MNGESTPGLMIEAAQTLIGAEPTPAAIEAAAATCAETSEPAADMHASEAYRRHLIRILTFRVVSRAADRART